MMGYRISRLTRSRRMGMMGGHYLFLGVLPEQAGETADINALYAARFGLPPVGKRAFVRTVQHIDGYTDVPKVLRVRPPASPGARLGQHALKPSRSDSNYVRADRSGESFRAYFGGKRGSPGDPQ